MPASGLGSNNSEMGPKSGRVVLNVPQPSPCQAAAAAAKKAPAASTTGGRRLGALNVPKGVLPTTLYSAFFLMCPLLNEFQTYDYSDAMVRTSVIAASVLTPVVIVAANDCVAWLNMAFAFHVGIEITVMSRLLNYYETTGKDADDMEQIMKWVAVGTIILHLVPFLFVDQPAPLGFLASVGIVVNTLVNTLIPDNNDLLLITGFSSSVLLANVLLIVCIDCISTSLLSQLRGAMKKGSWCKIAPFEY